MDIIERILYLIIAPAFLGVFGFGLLALLGLLWSPFAAMICARAARERGLDSSLFAQKGFAFSILYLIPCFVLLARIQGGATTSRGFMLATYICVYGIWLVAGIIGLIYFTAGEVDRVIINPMHFGDRGDLGALLWLAPAPIINIFLWVVSLRSLIRRDRRDREKRSSAASSPARAYTDHPDVSAAGIIPDRAYTNPFGFSLTGSVITLVLFIVSTSVRFNS